MKSYLIYLLNWGGDPIEIKAESFILEGDTVRFEDKEKRQVVVFSMAHICGFALKENVVPKPEPQAKHSGLFGK